MGPDVENEYTIKGERVWQMDAQRYQYLRGVHQPWIAEISPAQYAGISKRARREYDKKRTAEWQASADIKQEWYEKVTQAYVLGKFKLEDPGVSDATNTAVWRYETDLKEEREKVAQEQARKENQIISVNELEIGDRVHSIMYREYGRIIKKFKKSARIRWEKPLYTDGIQETTNDVGQLWWWSYNDMVERVKQSLPIRPDRFYAPPPEVPAAAPPPETEQEKILRELRTKYRFSRPEADTVNTAITSALVHRYVEAEDYNMVRRILEPVQDGGAIAEDLKEMVLGTYWQWPPPPPAAAPATELVEEEKEPAAEGHVHDKHHCPICGNHRVCGICGKEWYGSASGSKNFPILCKVCAEEEFKKEMIIFEKQQEKEFAKLDREIQKDETEPVFIGQDWECFKSGMEYTEAIKLEKELREAGRTVRKEPRGDAWDVYIRTWDKAAAPPAPQTLDEYIGIQKEETAVPEPPAEEPQKTLEQYLNGG